MLALGSLPGIAWAQQAGPGADGVQPGPLHEVVITGTREAEALSRTAASVGVIREETIRRTMPALPGTALYGSDVIGGIVNAMTPLPLDDYLYRPTTNYRPIAFRKVDALRLSSQWDHKLAGGGLLSVTPYLRHNTMDLPASFSPPSDPTVYTTENQSYGVAAKWRQDWGGALQPRLIAGAHESRRLGPRMPM